MSEKRITYSPECNQWTLADGRHHMEVPDWAREIMRDEFERETRPLRAENTRLRSELESVGTASYLYGRSDLKAEIAKLRELVRELWDQAEQNLVCDENCPYGAACDWMESDVVCVFKRRMRELGVEVD